MFTNGSSKIVNMLLQAATCFNNPLTKVLVKDRLCDHTSNWYWDKPPGGTGLFAVPLGTALSGWGSACPSAVAVGLQVCLLS